MILFPPIGRDRLGTQLLPRVGCRSGESCAEIVGSEWGGAKSKGSETAFVSYLTSAVTHIEDTFWQVTFLTILRDYIF